MDPQLTRTPWSKITLFKASVPTVSHLPLWDIHGNSWRITSLFVAIIKSLLQHAKWNQVFVGAHQGSSITLPAWGTIHDGDMVIGRSSRQSRRSNGSRVLLITRPSLKYLATTQRSPLASLPMPRFLLPKLDRCSEERCPDEQACEKTAVNSTR